MDTKDILSLPAGEKLDRSSLSIESSGSDDTQIYHFRFRPQNGLLNSLKPLLPKQEFTLSFDRASADLSLIASELSEDYDISGQVLNLRNPYLSVDYISSPYLRNYFDGVNSKGISYFYDEVSVYHKSLPLNDTIIRFTNLIGGNTPQFIFAGVISSDALSGSLTKSGTLFKRHNIKEFDLTLNGQSCAGFPMVNLDKTSLDVYDKFLTTTKRKFKNQCPEQILPGDFTNFNYLFSHKFEAEQTETGWVGINLKLTEAFKENHTLGKYLSRIIRY